MDSASKLQKIHTMNPSAADATTIFRMATISGAGALGLDHETGSLETGKKADIILVDTNKPHLVPMYNPVSHIVYSATGSDVRDVIINGEIIVQNRKILTLNMDDILAEARRFASNMAL
jgi:5-methylthioadenosine/S-adenosylhomocysteine deaminase